MSIADTLRALAGMESQSDDEALSKEAEALVDELVDKKVEAAMKELTDKIEDLEEEIEEQEELIEELEECVEGMEMLIKSGTNNLALSLLYNRADKLNVKLGGHSTLPRDGVESLDTKKIEAFAIVGCEGFTDMVKSGKDGLKEMFRRLLAMLTDLWNNFINDEKRIKARCDKFVEKIKAGELKEKVKLGKWARYFVSYSKKVDSDILQKLTNQERGEDEAVEILEDIIQMVSPTVDREKLIAECVALRESVKRTQSKIGGKKTTAGQRDVYNHDILQGVRFYNGPIETIQQAGEFLSSLRWFDEQTVGEVLPTDEVDAKYDAAKLLIHAEKSIPNSLTQIGKFKNLLKVIKDQEAMINKIAFPADLKVFCTKWTACMAASINTRSRWNHQMIQAELQMLAAHVK